MADFSSVFAPNPQCYLANTGGTNILLCREGCQGCGTSGCGKTKCCGKKRRKCRC